MTLPIDPSKPVAGNFRGTFAGAVAIMAAGFVAKKGLFTLCASFMCDDINPTSFMSCSDLEWTLAVLFMTVVGSAMNYAVTRITQIAKLKELYDMIPEVRAEYEQTEMPESQDPKRRG